MKRILFFLLVAGGLLLPPVFAADTTSVAAAAVKMPGFTLPDVTSGHKVKSEAFAGKALLVTFFASWCPVCLQEIPTLVKMHGEFASQGFSVVGLAVDQGDAVRGLIQRAGINFPVLMADLPTVENFGGVYMIPVSFLVNKSGQVVKKYPGSVPESVLVQDIRSVL